MSEVKQTGVPRILESIRKGYRRIMMLEIGTKAAAFWEIGTKAPDFGELS